MKAFLRNGQVLSTMHEVKESLSWQDFCASFRSVLLYTQLHLMDNDVLLRCVTTTTGRHVLGDRNRK
jgi:hypothetical protein